MARHRRRNCQRGARDAISCESSSEKGTAQAVRREFGQPPTHLSYLATPSGMASPSGLASFSQRRYHAYPESSDESSSLTF